MNNTLFVYFITKSENNSEILFTNSCERGSQKVIHEIHNDFVFNSLLKFFMRL